MVMTAIIKVNKKNCHLIKDLLQTLPCECRALHIPHRPHLVGKAHFDATKIHPQFHIFNKYWLSPLMPS